jgi:hypothetical protein
LGIGLDGVYLPSSPKMGYSMKTKLEALVSYLAGHEGDDAERLRAELGDPASEVNQFLTEIQALSRNALDERVLKWLGLPPHLPVNWLSAARQPTAPSVTRAVIRALPLLLSVAACLLAFLLWLDCQRHRHQLELALEEAHSGPRVGEAVDAVAAIARPKGLIAADGERQEPAPSQLVPAPVSAPGATAPVTEPAPTAKHPPDTDQQVKSAEPMPTTPTGPKQGNGKEQKPAGETSADRGAGGLPVVVEAAGPKPAHTRTRDHDKREESLKPDSVMVPQIVGLPYATAKKRIEAAGLVLKPAQGPENALVKRQAPAAETLVKRGEVIMATLSSETSPTPGLSRVPNLLGVTGAENAGKILKQAGLDFAAYRIVDGRRVLIVPKNYPQLENLKVTQQLPAQGTLVAGLTCVECVFAARREVPPPQITPPNVIGKSNVKSEKK